MTKKKKYIYRMYANNYNATRHIMNIWQRDRNENAERKRKCDFEIFMSKMRYNKTECMQMALNNLVIYRETRPHFLKPQPKTNILKQNNYVSFLQ